MDVPKQLLAGPGATAALLHAAIRSALQPHVGGVGGVGGGRIEHHLLAAAAFLATEASAVPEDPHCFALCSALCHAPLSRLVPELMDLAVFAWTWVSTAAPQWLLPLVSCQASAWARSVDQGRGLFSGGQHQGGASTPADVLDALASHKVWTVFMGELWRTLGDRLDTEQQALFQIVGRLLLHSLSRVSRLSSHPAAVAPRFNFLALVLRSTAHTMRQMPKGTTAKDFNPGLVLLHDRAIQVGRGGHTQWGHT